MSENCLEINLFYKGHGWILLKFITPSNDITIYLSSCFDPFPELVKWLEDISFDKLPSGFIIDEEGEGKRLIADQSDNSDNSFIFKIYEWDWGREEHTENEKLLLKYEFTTIKFIESFVNSIIIFISQNKDLMWNARYRLIDLIYNLNQIKSNAKLLNQNDRY